MVSDCVVWQRLATTLGKDTGIKNKTTYDDYSGLACGSADTDNKTMHKRIRLTTTRL